MTPIYRTRRLSITVAAVAAAALALPACQGTATAASHRPHQHAAHVTVQPTENGLTIRDLKDLAKRKRDLSRRITQQMQTGLTFADLQDLANVKRGLFRR